jgi:hypothetical protein
MTTVVDRVNRPRAFSCRANGTGFCCEVPPDRSGGADPRPRVRPL